MACTAIYFFVVEEMIFLLFYFNAELESVSEHNVFLTERRRKTPAASKKYFCRN